MNIIKDNDMDNEIEIQVLDKSKIKLKLYENIDLDEMTLFVYSEDISEKELDEYLEIEEDQIVGNVFLTLKNGNKITIYDYTVAKSYGDKIIYLLWFNEYIDGDHIKDIKKYRCKEVLFKFDALGVKLPFINKDIHISDINYSYVFINTKSTFYELKIISNTYEKTEDIINEFYLFHEYLFLYIGSFLKIDAIVIDSNKRYGIELNPKYKNLRQNIDKTEIIIDDFNEKSYKMWTSLRKKIGVIFDIFLSLQDNEKLPTELIISELANCLQGYYNKTHLNNTFIVNEAKTKLYKNIEKEISIIKENRQLEKIENIIKGNILIEDIYKFIETSIKNKNSKDLLAIFEEYNSNFIVVKKIFDNEKHVLNKNFLKILKEHRNYYSHYNLNNKSFKQLDERELFFYYCKLKLMIRIIIISNIDIDLNINKLEYYVSLLDKI